MYLENRLRDFPKKEKHNFEATKRQGVGLILKKKQGDVFQKPMGDISMHIQCVACYAFQKCGCLLNAACNNIQ